MDNGKEMQAKGTSTKTNQLIEAGDAYIRQWMGSSLDQIMSFRLFGAKPLSEPTLTCFQLRPIEHISIKCFIKLKQYNPLSDAVYLIAELKY